MPMPPGLRDLNALAPEAAAAALHSCCGSSRWVKEMVARRPFASGGALLDAADEVWRAIGPTEWAEAFAGHPRIGDTAGSGGAVMRPGGSDRAGAWSEAEQRRAATADEGIRRALAEVNAEYERRFGRIYIVCATGRTAHELLADAGRRLDNDPTTELRVAAEEQRKITALRLRKLIEGAGPDGPGTLP